jgi:hypothetical protein
MTQRQIRHPYLSLFDAPDTNTSTDMRTISTVPLQALYMLNNPFVLSQAESFAKRLIAVSPDPELRITAGAEIAWGRELSVEEIRRYTGYILRYRAESLRSGASPVQAELAAWSSFTHALIAANEFLYVD